MLRPPMEPATSRSRPSSCRRGRDRSVPCAARARAYERCRACRRPRRHGPKGGSRGRRRARVSRGGLLPPAAAPSSARRPRRPPACAARRRAAPRTGRTDSARAARLRAAASSSPGRTRSRPAAAPASPGRRSSCGGNYRRVLAVLYDIHGNLPALEAVLADAGGERPEAYLLGGDYGTPSPWPRETLDLLRALEPATWIRGNGERWIRERPTDRPEVAETYDEFLPGSVPDEELEWLYSLPPQVELDGVLYVHGCVGRDDDSFAPEPAPEDEHRCGGVRETTIVFGHSHLQFRRD